jgi:hypothetical protein
MSTDVSDHCSVARSRTAQPTTLTGTFWYGQPLWPTITSIHFLNWRASDAWMRSRSAALTGALESQRTQ